MFLAASLASVLWLGTPAAEPAASSAPAKPSPRASAAQPSAKKKIIRLDAITVEGRIQKPQAFYILQRSNLSFGELSRSDSFVPKVIHSVDKDPF